MHRSKWEILTARANEMREKLERLESEIRGLEMTKTPNTVCTGCGTPLPTERDFAGHFLIPNEYLLNTGYCPNNRRNI